MKRSYFHLVTCLAALAFIATGTAHAQNNKGSGSTSVVPGAPIVIPGGAFTTAYVISTSGSYVLGGDRVTNGSVHNIEINAANVTLDLNGFTLTQWGSTKAGVYIPFPDNVEIRNGSIERGSSGIWGLIGHNVRVKQVRVMGSLWGIELQASCEIEHCQIYDASNVGIFVVDSPGLITDCIVQSSGSESYGVSAHAGSRVTRTLVSGSKFGIVLSNASAVDCTAAQCQTGVKFTKAATLRNCDVQNNTLGVLSSGVDNVITGSRISNNTTNVSGSYTQGIGNTLL
jgi:hypothetical protein